MIKAEEDGEEERIRQKRERNRHNLEEEDANKTKIRTEKTNRKKPNKERTRQKHKKPGENTERNQDRGGHNERRLGRPAEEEIRAAIERLKNTSGTNKRRERERIKRKHRMAQEKLLEAKRIVFLENTNERERKRVQKEMEVASGFSFIDLVCATTSSTRCGHSFGCGNHGCDHQLACHV